jgi:hypothetical protein
MINVALNIRPLRHRHLIRGKSSIEFTVSRESSPRNVKHLHLMSATVLACSMAAGGVDSFELCRVPFQVVNCCSTACKLRGRESLSQLSLLSVISV